MSLWVLDTDHISEFQRGNSKVVHRISTINPDNIAVTIINVEEQIRGQLQEIHKRNKLKPPSDSLVQAYANFWETVKFFNNIHVLDFDQEAFNYYKELKRPNTPRTQDLKIASIVLSKQAILVTRNRQDFEKIPNLQIEDWTV